MNTPKMTQRDLQVMIRVASLYHRQGKKQQEIAKQLKLSRSQVSRLLTRARGYLEISFNIPTDDILQTELIDKYELCDALTVETGDQVEETGIIGAAAARYFISEVFSGQTVALSCGSTLLAMVKAVHTDTEFSPARIVQLSIEGDAESSHQSPAAIVGVLKSKCSDTTELYAIQLPPYGLADSERQYRQELAACDKVKKLRTHALGADFVFIGVGTGASSKRLLRMAQHCTEQDLGALLKARGAVAEVNNRPLDRHGIDLTDEIPGLSSYFINILDIDDLRDIVAGDNNQKVVVVASGKSKVQALDVVLRTKVANVVITSRSTAKVLLDL